VPIPALIPIDNQVDAVNLGLPSEVVLPGVLWGRMDAFPSPAYWAYLAQSAERHEGGMRHRLGDTLLEEVGACLLGGHGIPAAVGIAAFLHLKALDAFNSSDISEEQLHAWLSVPLQVQGRLVRYRFAAQKARYLQSAILHFASGEAPREAKELRSWLMRIQGIGYKTASWVVRNWLDSDEVAILDVHILRVGRAVGLFPESLSVERHYLALEELFLRFSQALGVRASELDAIIWREMASSPMAVRLLDEQMQASQRPGVSSSRAQRRQPNARQLQLLV
jgi:N-glycosylase/DNA lyase